MPTFRKKPVEIEARPFGVHRWGATCPCKPTSDADGSLRHHSLDGTGWTERVECCASGSCEVCRPGRGGWIQWGVS